METKDLFFNRELGLIQFYRRVLSQVTDLSVPLLERLFYLCVVTKNCDELFEVRVARLLKKQRKETRTMFLADGLSIDEALVLVRSEIKKLYKDIYSVYYKTMRPSLSKNGIDILDQDEWNEEQRSWIKAYFMTELKPVLTPIGVDPTHPFPRVPNKNLHFAVELSGIDQFGRESKIAIVEAPRILQRVVQLPLEISNNRLCFVLLQDIVREHVNEFFYGMKVLGCYPFRVTRSSDLDVDANQKNIRSALSRELQNRKYSECSRFEIDVLYGEPSSEFIDVLLKQFSLERSGLYAVNGPVNLARLSDIIDMVDDPKLQFPKFKAGLPPELDNGIDIFEAMGKSDILLHTPYQSFDPVIELTRRAATDPDILSIRMTLYRTGSYSEIVQNLVNAAIAGKKVVASVELFARFDEEANIEVATRLLEAGVHVVYGVMGYKVHAKMLTLVRRENGTLKHYLHLGTGNYHQSTAKVYTDFGLLTTNQAIAQDVDNIFNQITGVGRSGMLNVLYQSPFTLYDMVINSIERETNIAFSGGKAEIIAKMNSLVEIDVIKALYRASNAGVKITLIVRGACSLRPGIKGYSENITVKSVVGRFLEHHRIFYFYDAGKENVFIASADWMGRNFFRRVETCVPILDAKVKQQVITEGLQIYMQDNVDAWEMQTDGSYVKLNANGTEAVSAQNLLLTKLSIGWVGNE